MKESALAIKVLNIDHLVIIAGIIDEMELVEEVNKKVGIKTKETLTPGQVMKAMILNGLGFLSAPLYLFEKFFGGKATEHLIGEGVLPSHLNDDRLARTLDKYYQAGTTKLFTAIALKAAQKFQVKMNSIHLDGSSMYVHGEDENTGGEKEVNPANQSGELVEAIAMIMGLCLLVYTLAQRKLRPELESSGSGIKNQVNKLTNRPTMRWVFQVFQAVHLIIVNGEKQVSNLTEEHQKILYYLGKVVVSII